MKKLLCYKTLMLFGLVSTSTGDREKQTKQTKQRNDTNAMRLIVLSLSRRTLFALA